MRTTLIALLGLSLFACRGGGGGGDDDDTPPPDGPPGGKVTIQQVQSDDMPVGTAVTLENVVVTAIDSFGARTGDLWVEDAAGGEFSGIKVFGAPLNQVANLQPGDIVTITNAEKDEFALTADTSGRTVTELKGAAGGQLSVTRIGPGTLPTPVAVDALAIGMLDAAARDLEWEKYEGVLISVSNAKALTNIGDFGDANDDQFEFKITGDARVQSAMTALPESAAAGDCYANLVGVGDYFFNWLVLPREPTDLAAGGATCAPEEEGDAACGDEIDNDGDGFLDCADFSCQFTAAACSTATSVASIQMGTTTGTVALSNVIVTARDEIGNDKGVWVADAAQGAEFNGIFVFTGSSVDPTFVVGASVNLVGTVQEFDFQPAAGDTVTEIGNATVALVAGAPVVPTPLTTTADVAGDLTNGEPVEGVLVRVADVHVTNAALGNGKVEFTDNDGNKVVVDDDLFTTADGNNPFPAVEDGDCKTVVGVMHMRLDDNIRTLLPRTAADLTVSTGCN